MFTRIERIFGRYAIHNLTIYLVVLIAMFNSYVLLTNDASLGTISINTLFSSHWWNIFLFPFRLADDWLSLAIYLYVFWIFGTNLESDIGAAVYNLYIFTGLFFVSIGAIFFPQITASFVYLSIFFAASYRQPDMQILLFFILPVAMKWIALVTIGYILFQSAQLALTLSSFLPLLGPVIGFGNFLLFFGPEILTNLRRGQRRRIEVAKLNPVRSHSIHSCEICGITENDNPDEDFRYCEKCTGDHEYCSKHLHDHQHRI